MCVVEEHDVVVGVGRLRWEMSMLRGARSMVLIRAGGVGVSRSLRMRKVSGSIPDQSSYFYGCCYIVHGSRVHASSAAGWLFGIVSGARTCGTICMDEMFVGLFVCWCRRHKMLWLV